MLSSEGFFEREAIRRRAIRNALIRLSATCVRAACSISGIHALVNRFRSAGVVAKSKFVIDVII